MKRFSSIMVRTIIALLCLTTLTLAVITLLFTRTVTKNQYEANLRRQEENIQSISTLLDHSFYDYLSLSTQISNIPELRPANLRLADSLSQIDGKKQLQTLKVVNGRILDLCLYMCSENFFLTSTATYLPAYFMQSYYTFSRYSRADLYDTFRRAEVALLSGRAVPEYLSVGTVRTSDQETVISDALLILTPIPQWARNPYAVLGIFIQTADIREQLSLVAGEGAARIIDAHGQTLVEVGAENLEHGFEDDPQVRVFQQSSRQFGLTYETRIKEEDLHRTNLTVSQFFLPLTLLAMCAFLGSLLFAKWVNQPLRDLLRHLSGSGRFMPDESAYIRQYIYQLHRSVEQNTRNVDELLVHRLLAGTQLNKAELARCENVLKKDYAHCTAMVVRLGKRPETMLSLTTIELAHSLINIVPETRPNTLICIIACDETGDALRKQAEALRTEAPLKDATTFALGSVEDDLTRLHASMLRAEALMKEMLYQGQTGVAMASRPNERRSSYPAEKMFGLKTALQAEDAPRIRELGEQLCDALLDARMSSETGVIVICDLAILLPELADKVTASAQTFCDALRDCLNKRAAALEQRAAAPSGETAQLKHEIAEDIEAMLEQPGFGISMISQKYHYSDSAFSHMFKRTFDVNFITYINQRKIQRAKSILLDESVSLDAVASRLGYSSASNFSRMFKNYEGITPGAYRQLVRTESFPFSEHSSAQ